MSERSERRTIGDIIAERREATQAFLVRYTTVKALRDLAASEEPVVEQLLSPARRSALGEWREAHPEAFRGLVLGSVAYYDGLSDAYDEQARVRLQTAEELQGLADQAQQMLDDLTERLPHDEA